MRSQPMIFHLKVNFEGCSLGIALYISWLEGAGDNEMSKVAMEIVSLYLFVNMVYVQIFLLKYFFVSPAS